MDYKKCNSLRCVLVNSHLNGFRIPIINSIIYVVSDIDKLHWNTNENASYLIVFFSPSPYTCKVNFYQIRMQNRKSN